LLELAISSVILQIGNLILLVWKIDKPIFHLSHVISSFMMMSALASFFDQILLFFLIFWIRNPVEIWMLELRKSCHGLCVAMGKLDNQ